MVIGIVRRPLTTQRAMQERSHESIDKIVTKYSNIEKFCKLIEHQKSFQILVVPKNIF